MSGKLYSMQVLAFIHIVGISKSHQMNVQSIKGSIIYKGWLTFQYTLETTSMCHTKNMCKAIRKYN